MLNRKEWSGDCNCSFIYQYQPDWIQSPFVIFYSYAAQIWYKWMHVSIYINKRIFYWTRVGLHTHRRCLVTPHCKNISLFAKITSDYCWRYTNKKFLFLSISLLSTRVRIGNDTFTNKHFYSHGHDLNFFLIMYIKF